MTTTLSFDIEEFDFPIERGKAISVKDQIDISTEGLEYILKILAKREIRATFYITANYAKHRPDSVKKIAQAGHEIASHDYYHSMESGSNSAESKMVLQELTGKKIIGYRAPRLLNNIADTLKKSGFKYDSSINPTWIPGRYNNIRHPRTAVSKNGIIIYPVSVSYPLRIPLFWLALHVMPLCVYEHFARTALRHDKNLSLYFHPWEFCNAIKKKEYNVPFYITRCCGTEYCKKFEKLIDDFISDGVVFKTTEEYLSDLF